MSTPSKKTTDHGKILNYLAHSIDNHLLDKSAEIAAALFGSRVTPQAEVHVHAVLDGMRHTVREHIVAEREADLALASDRIETDDARALSHQAINELVEALRSYRESMASVYGRAILPRYGMGEVVPTAIDPLETYVENVIQQLRKRPLTERPIVRGFGTFDAAAAAAELTELKARCGYAADETRREEREDETALLRRNQVRATAWTAYLAVATIAEASLRIIGRPELADRVRVTRNRRMGVPEPIDIAFDETGREPTVAPPVEEPADA